MTVLGITGPHGTGKTTLCNALLQTDKFRGYTYCDEVTRWVKSIGFDINESGGDTTQELIVMRHAYNLFKHDQFITDRVMLDCYVYSKYLYYKDCIGDSTMNNVEKAFLRTLELHSYDYLCLVLPEFSLEDDGVRSVNVQFQKDITKIFREVIEAYDMEECNNLFQVSGTVEERVKQILRVVKY